MSDIPMLAIMKFKELAIQLAPGTHKIQSSPLLGDEVELTPPVVDMLKVHEGQAYLHLEWEREHLWKVVNIHPHFADQEVT